MRVSWNLLAGIGRIESMHANEGATDARGTAVNPIYGPALDGSLPGNGVIVDSRAANGRTVYARAMGPMQFLPGTWMRYGADGDGDGQANPQNLFDATLAAAHYLCSGGLNLRDQSQVITAVLRYNKSMPYTQNVLGWAVGYATGVPPVDLPPITGPIPPISDTRMETNLIDVNPADDGPDGTWDGTQDETFTDDPGEDGTALDQAGSTLGQAPPTWATAVMVKAVAVAQAVTAAAAAPRRRGMVLRPESPSATAATAVPAARAVVDNQRRLGRRQATRRLLLSAPAHWRGRSRRSRRARRCSRCAQGIGQATTEPRATPGNGATGGPVPLQVTT